MSEVAAFRLYKEKYADSALTGEGAWIHGGRWNDPRVRMVYCASSPALAQLEMLVNLRPLPPDRFELLELSIPESCVGKRVSVEELEKFGFDWRAHPPHMLLQEIGSEWIASATSAVMEVPIAVSTHDSNFLLNPAHPDLQKIKSKPPEPLVWDLRLIDISRGL